ncbi:MAG: tetratricopeptide repeat protein [bacterium]
MQFRNIFLFVVLGLFIPSCAYYNTFYNTKKYYKEAQKERERRKGDKPSSTELNKYNQTIEKASKILEIYPNSKYVDDAVLILGECFYYKGDYVKAQRKFVELTTYFPESDYFQKGRLWLAKTKIKLDDYLGAKFILQELIEGSKIKRDIRDESRFLQGEIYFDQGRYPEAEKEFKIVAVQAKKKSIKANAYFQLGQSHINTKKYQEAVDSFKKALKYSHNEPFAFEAELHLARAWMLAGKFKKSKEVCYNLLETDVQREKLGLVKLQIAECIYREGRDIFKRLKGADVTYLGKIEEALDEYKKITLEYKRTDISAQAYFQMAKIYEEDYGDFNLAKENYNKVKLEYTKSEYVPISLEKAKNISDLIRLKGSVKKSQGLQLSRGDNAQHNFSELELLLLEHGVHPELRFMKKQRKLAAENQAAVAEPQNKDDDLDALVVSKLQLAEVYLFQFGQVDSALFEYNEIARLFPEHRGAAKALYSSAFIYENEYLNKFKTDSLLYVLIERFPDSYQAREARKKLGLPATVIKMDPAEDLYKRAESMLFTINNVVRARANFWEIIEKYPESIYAPKALYALGWIYENISFENEKAIEIYQKILDDYPKSEYSNAVKKKLSEVERALKKQEAAAQKAQMEANGKTNESETKVKLTNTKTPNPNDKPPAANKTTIKEPVPLKNNSKKKSNKPIP